VFGRRAGRFAAERVRTAKLGKLTLGHMETYERWLDGAGDETDRKAPILLPEYRGKKNIEHQLKLL
jgi:succinate dehydrogenase / fumarate reductase flavoprotein subunit